MKSTTYPDTDNLYAEFKDTAGVETHEVAEGLDVDVGAAGEVVGFNLDHTAKRFELKTLEVDALPVR